MRNDQFPVMLESITAALQTLIRVGEYAARKAYLEAKALNKYPLTTPREW